MKYLFNAISRALLILVLLAPSPSSFFAAALPQGDDPKAKADALYQEGLDLYNQADYQGAVNNLAAALTIYQSIGDQDGEANALHMLGVVYTDLGQYSQALDDLKQALAISQAMHDAEGEEQTVNTLGLVYFDQGQYSQALDYFQQALALAQENGDRYGEGAILSGIGAVYSSEGKYSQALEFLQKALAIAKELGDQRGETNRLINIGATYSGLGQYSQALDSYQQALALTQQLRDPSREEVILSNIGSVYDGQGHYQQALDYHQRALSIAREIGDRPREAVWLSDIASAYGSLGQYQQALDSYQQALAIAKEIGDRGTEGGILNGLGSVYSNLSQYERALDFYQQALAIMQEIGAQDTEAVSLSRIGETYYRLGQYQQALANLQQALTIVRESGNRSGEARALSEIALIDSALGEDQQALDYDVQALAIAREMGDQEAESAILDNTAVAYQNLNQSDKALAAAQQALEILQQTGNRQGQAASLNNIAFAYEKLGQTSQALDYYQRALSVEQEVGDRVGQATILTNRGAFYDRQGQKDNAINDATRAIEITESVQGETKVEELKASFAAQHVDAYDLLVGLLWDQGHYAEAFNYVERSRARAFLDQLGRGSVDFRTGVDAKLLQREQSLNGEIAALREQLAALRNRPQNEWDTDAIARAEADLTARQSDYAQLLTDMKLQSPEVASLVSVDVASLSDVQKLLDTNTTLVEYYVAENRTLAFVITHDRLDTIALNVSRDDLAKTITGFREFASLDDAHPASLKQLYTWLIAPLKDKLKTPVLGIVPHGILHYLPFAALTDGTRYLGDDFSLFTLPSTSVLRFIEKNRKPSMKTILALGNPASDEPGLAPLHFAKQEVETVSAPFNSRPLVGSLATESALKSQVSEASIVHIAAHGQYNQQNPLFSAIFLAGDSTNDGRLEVNEIYSLDLRKATDLVVLSACQTDVGAVSRGDEVVGMTRAFLYAGTPTVIASLWNVDDAATTLLMERFYKHLREGQGKAQALRQAQIDVRAKYPNPYYWAAFVLTGDPGADSTSPLFSIGAHPSLGLMIAVAVAAVILAVFITLLIILVRRRRRVLA